MLKKNAKIYCRIEKNFCGKVRHTFKISKNFPFIWDLPFNLFWGLPNLPNLLDDWILVQDSKVPLIQENKTIWESDADLNIFWKPFDYIRANHKFILKYIKILNWIFWVIDYRCDAQNCSLFSTHVKLFICEGDVFFKFELPIYLFWRLPKS